jgi:dTMP kinase
MISLRKIISEKRSIVPDEKVKERSWVIVFRYNPQFQLLLVKDDEGGWSFPGGQLDNEETAEQAAWRELKEETGVNPEKMDFLKTIYHDKPNKLKVSHIFYTEVSRDTPLKARDDVEKSQWVDTTNNEILKKLSHPKKELIKLASKKVYDAKKEVKEHLYQAIALNLPVKNLSNNLLSEAKHKKTSNGYLIVFEGIDGGGKSTQRKLLKKWLENKKWKVTVSKWGTSPAISELLKKAKNEKWLTPILFSLLHASDMLWRYENEIQPALDKGHVVICDRYYYTSYVRDLLRGVNKKLLDEVYQKFLEPDLVIHFQVNPRLAIERLLKDKGFKWYSSGMDIGYHPNMEECALMYEVNMDKVYNVYICRKKY